MTQTKASWLPIFVNKVLLEHSHVQSFPYPMAAFALQGQCGVVLKRRAANKDQNIYFQVLYGGVAPVEESFWTGGHWT
jgi:hypothetical protein